MSTISFDIAGSQIDGARDYQEDAFLITRLGDRDADSAAALIVVADGMGGHAAGNVASNMAVQTFNRHLSKNYPNDNPAEVLHEAILQANGSIAATVAETAALKGMGCTLVACVLERGKLRWVSVGDSHLYVLRDGQLLKKNADHSYGGFLDRMAQAGTPIEAESGFSRNMLMSALTGDDIAEIDCPDDAMTLRSSDRIIIASDGLDTLGPEEIVEICAGSSSAKQCVDHLLEGVTAAGAPRQDNTTIVVVDCTEKADAAVAGTVPEAPLEPASPPAIDLNDALPAGAPRPGPFPIEDEPRKSRLPLIGAVAVTLALVAGAAYWYLSPTDSTWPAPLLETDPTTDPGTPEIVADAAQEAAQAEDDLTELAPVEPEPVSPAARTPDPSSRSGEFSDPLASGGRGPRMVWIPAGRFTMGGLLPTDDASEFPQHEVRIAQFAMSVHEVTIAQYRRFARATGTRMPDVAASAGTDEERFPMYFVSWNDALAYSKWLSKQTGHDYSLPTEAQWEYAARAGTTSPYHWGRHLGRGNAHCFACDTGLDPRQPTAVGRFEPNAFGLYDMAGNIQEWVYDCFHPNYQGAPTDGSVFEGGDCTVRVLRGGGYASGPGALRSSARDTLRFDRGNDQTGIRVVRNR
ncbi:MAG: SUMF1/EgtB/PvdO family nonheme iron enzyme [Gammaproteobacteria bacterium]